MNQAEVRAERCSGQRRGHRSTRRQRAVGVSSSARPVRAGHCDSASRSSRSGPTEAHHRGARRGASRELIARGSVRAELSAASPGGDSARLCGGFTTWRRLRASSSRAADFALLHQDRRIDSAAHTGIARSRRAGAGCRLEGGWRRAGDQGPRGSVEACDLHRSICPLMRLHLRHEDKPGVSPPCAQWAREAAEAVVVLPGCGPFVGGSKRPPSSERLSGRAWVPARVVRRRSVLLGGCGSRGTGSC